jgi:hypothetical protein
MICHRDILESLAFDFNIALDLETPGPILQKDAPIAAFARSENHNQTFTRGAQTDTAEEPSTVSTPFSLSHRIVLRCPDA